MKIKNKYETVTEMLNRNRATKAFWVNNRKEREPLDSVWGPLSVLFAGVVIILAIACAAQYHGWQPGVQPSQVEIHTSYGIITKEKK